MEKQFFFVLIYSFLFLHCSQPKDIIEKDYQLVWSDEFDIDGSPNQNKWSFDIGTACDQPAGCGWGNNERQYYRKENASVVNGLLIIEAKKEPYKEDRNYTSARLNSLNKGDWKFGKMEIRAKLPTGRGTWPAIWMLPTEWKYGGGGWPACGEIDIMEHVGFAKDTIYGTVHTESYNGMRNTQKTGLKYFPKVEEAFQTYAIEWDEEKIEWYINGKIYHTFKNDNSGYKGWPFDQKFHLVLNLAVGGHWGGRHGVDDSIWPQQMQVDYVRVYQRKIIAD